MLPHVVLKEVLCAVFATGTHGTPGMAGMDCRQHPGLLAFSLSLTKLPQFAQLRVKEVIYIILSVFKPHIL